MSRPKKTHEMLAVLTESGRREVEKFNAEQSRIAELETKAQALDKLPEQIASVRKKFGLLDKPEETTWQAEPGFWRGYNSCFEDLEHYVADAILSASDEAKESQ